MSDTFVVSFTGPPETMLAKAQAAATVSSNTFTGDTTSGSFRGKGVAGTYSVNGQNITITITDSPWYLPYWVIENKVRGFFAS